MGVKLPETVNDAEKISPLLSDYIAIARPDHWFKNIFMIPGAAVAYVLGAPLNPASLLTFALALISTCLIASANYTINEFLDAKFDSFHPVKSQRPSVSGRISAQLVAIQWLVLGSLGLVLAWYISPQMFLAAGLLLAMGGIYNVQPFRTKDRIYIDVLSESINNPIRFLLGWLAFAPAVFPPSSILIAYWMGGAFLMAVKRYAEYRFIDDPVRAGLYRASFRRYTQETLILSAFFYATTSAFFLGIFLIKYRIEFILSLPLFALLFVWYLHLGMRLNSVTQTPEKLYKEKHFMLFLILLTVVVVTLFFVDIAWLEILVTSRALN